MARGLHLCWLALAMVRRTAVAFIAAGRTVSKGIIWRGRIGGSAPAERLRAPRSMVRCELGGGGNAKSAPSYLSVSVRVNSDCRCLAGMHRLGPCAILHMAAVVSMAESSAASTTWIIKAVASFAELTHKHAMVAHKMEGDEDCTPYLNRNAMGIHAWHK